MRPVTILVDAGHGGKDPGTTGVSPIPEKTIVLSIANQIAELLSSAGARVITSRDSDFFVSLDNRAAMAERYRADLLVSIHADSAERASASGTTVYIARNASRQSVQVAERIVASFRSADIASRGIHRAGFRVLVGHSRPSVLVECGFLTNRRDASLLNTAAYQERVSRAIAEGIADHFSR
jgi:N-acetylmuramoyl-L-alanine amidase